MQSEPQYPQSKACQAPPAMQVHESIPSHTTKERQHARPRYTSPRLAPVLATCSAAVALAFALMFGPSMRFIKDKVIAPLAGHAAKHTSPELGHRAVDALGANMVRQGTYSATGVQLSCKKRWQRLVTMDSSSATACL